MHRGTAFEVDSNPIALHLGSDTCSIRYTGDMQRNEESLTYAPLNTLKPVADNIWVVDGPVIRASVAFFHVPFPTRMTVIRLDGGKLFIHSPTPLTPDLRLEVETIGTPAYIIGPNLLHYWWIPDWKSAFASASVYLAPGIKARAKGRLSFDGLALTDAAGFPWDSEIATLPVAGKYLTEIEFFHFASRTLVLTDFIENFESEKLQSFGMRWLTRIGGVQEPEGSMPRDARLTFSKQRLRVAIEQMIAWNPERVIFAHGRWYRENGVGELRRAFRWVL
jgi:Domain of unknown function (DUF4336)